MTQTAAEKRELLEAWGDLIDPREYYWDDYGNPFGVGTSLGSLASTYGARKHGRNEPFFRSEKELFEIQSQARLLAGVNLTGVTILDRLTDYAISTGYKRTTAPINGGSPELCDAVLHCLDEFAELNGWDGDRDRELFARGARDGEAFLTLHACEDQTLTRVVEPEYVTAPDRPSEIEPTCGLGDTPIDWEFGVATPADDIESPLGYHVLWNRKNTSDFDYYTTSQLVHIKSNVDRNVKRGLSDYYPALRRINRSGDLLTNIIEGAAARAAIAWVEEYPEGTPKSAAAAGQMAKADLVRTQYTPGGNQKQVYGQRMNPASILRPQPGKKYVEGPNSGEAAEQHLMVLQAALRIVGGRWGMPEYMISGDASNNNYASILEAGTPFNRSITHKQHVYAGHFKRVFWIVIYNAYRAGRFSQWVQSFAEIKRQVAINLEPPKLESVDKFQETNRNKDLSMAGIISDDTWAAREGVDLEEERNKGAARWDAKPTTVIGTTPGATSAAAGVTAGGTEAPTVAKPVAEEFDESKHPRGHEGNAGQFGPGGNAGATKKKEASKPATDKADPKVAAVTKTPQFKAWFGDSKVVDSKGEPLVVYHGTNAEFDEFDLKHARASDIKGVFFATNDSLAGSFGASRIIKAFVNIRKPATFADVERLAKNGVKTPQLHAALMKEGFDGIFDKSKGLVVAFDPRQIKSVDNRGTFDPSSKKLQESDQRPPSWLRRFWWGY